MPNTDFQAITVHQLGQSPTRPDYYSYYRIAGGRFFLVEVVLGDGTYGGLLSASGGLLRFPCKEVVQRFCLKCNRAEKARIDRLVAYGLLAAREVG